MEKQNLCVQYVIQEVLFNKLKTLINLKSVSIDTISNLTDFKIEQIFKEAKYHKQDYKPNCPFCGSFKKRKVNNKFRCKDCYKFYSITKDTIFENHKLPLRKYLLSIFLFVNSVKGLSSLQLSRELNISQKNSFVILHKIRTALFNQYEMLNQNKLKGNIQIDGAYINYLPKKKNKKKDREDRRELKHQNQECIITMREVNGNIKDRSYAFIIKNENKEDIEKLINLYIEQQSTIITDEHTSYKGIKNICNINGETLFNHKSVNHSEEYQNDEGVNTNFAESYFSRLRRMVIGQHHSLSKKYLELYVNEITYRENMRNYTNTEVLIDILKHCMNCKPNTNFNRYFQRKK